MSKTPEIPKEFELAIANAIRQLVEEGKVKMCLDKKTRETSYYLTERENEVDLENVDLLDGEEKLK